MQTKSFGLDKIRALLPTKHASRTLGRARRYLAIMIADEGVRCPCCRKWCKINGHKMNGSVVRALIWLVNASTAQQQYVNVPGTAPKWLTRTNVLSKAAYWGLVQRQKTTHSKKKSAGFWAPTPRGLDFVLGKIQIPCTAFTYDAEVVGYSSDRVKASDIKTTEHDYWEEMRLTWMAEKLEFPS